MNPPADPPKFRIGSVQYLDAALLGAKNPVCPRPLQGLMLFHEPRRHHRKN
jgi:hypothetical protein